MESINARPKYSFPEEEDSSLEIMARAMGSMSNATATFAIHMDNKAEAIIKLRINRRREEPSL